MLRRARRTGKQIAAELDLSPATVSRILKRLGLNRIDALEPTKPVHRYERARPGEMIHIDIKKLGRFKTVGHRISGDPSPPFKSRGAGWEFVHVAIDDHSRVAFAKVMANERKGCATAFLKAALGYYESLGIKVERVMTDNGSCYRSFAFRRACRRLGLKHIRTKAYSPQTNGKAERFIQTSLREWAYAHAYQSSRQRRAELPFWLHRYNWHRPHAGIDDSTPISRLGLPENNVLRTPHLEHPNEVVAPRFAAPICRQSDAAGSAGVCAPRRHLGCFASRRRDGPDARARSDSERAGSLPRQRCTPRAYS